MEYHLGDYDFSHETVGGEGQRERDSPESHYLGDHDFRSDWISTLGDRAYGGEGWDIPQRKGPDYLGIGSSMDLKYGPNEGFWNSGVGPGGIRWDGLPLGAGAGAAQNDAFVPDRIWDVDVVVAAFRHDKCYSTCGVSKNECDSQFGQDVYDACHARDHSDLVCDLLEFAFWAGVHFGGNDAYKDAQQEACGGGGGGPLP